MQSGDLISWQKSYETNSWRTRLWSMSSTLTVGGLFMEAFHFCCDNKLLRSHHSTARSKNTLTKSASAAATGLWMSLLALYSIFLWWLQTQLTGCKKHDSKHPSSQSTLANKTETANLLRGFSWTSEPGLLQRDPLPTADYHFYQISS